METRALPYVEWMTSESLMHEAECPGPVLCDDLVGWCGEVREMGGGFRMGETHVYLWPIHVDV